MADGGKAGELGGEEVSLRELFQRGIEAQKKLENDLIDRTSKDGQVRFVLTDA